ncbi:MAG TPA: helix-turn-helix domain-containing protein [Croceibacterium sp.]
MNALTVSVDEAAKATSLSKPTINRYIASGKIKSRKVGRRRLIDAESLRKFVGAE